MAFNPETFLIEEYKGLRKEIEIQLTESRALERYTIVALGVIWGWLMTQKAENWLLWMIPVLLSAISFFRRWAVNRYFRILKEYLKKVEDAFGVKGWEHEDRPWNIGATEITINSFLVILSIAGLVLRKILAAH